MDDKMSGLNISPRTIRIFHNFFSRTDWSRFIIWTCYFFVFCVLMTLFVENFVFSKGFNIIRFRGIDDVAFHETLRRVHVIIRSGLLTPLWEVNDYAYGWIYWIPLAFLTYPCYWLSTRYQIDWPLIVFPREYSLIFAIASLYILRKLLRKIGVPSWGIAVAVLSFSLFSTFGYFSIRFATVNMVMFFSILSFYFAHQDNPSTLKGRFFTATSMALAGGVKLSGLLIAPLIFGLTFLHLQNKKYLHKAIQMSFFLLMFLFLLVVFSNPALILAPWYPEIGVRYFETLKHFVGVTKMASSFQSPLDRFYSVLLGGTIQAMSLAVFSMGFFIQFIKDKKSRPELLVYLSTFLLVVSYLIFTVKNGSSAGTYFTAISFLFLLGVVGWGGHRLGKVALCCASLLLFGDLVHRSKSQFDSVSSNWSHLTYFIERVKSEPDIELAEYIENCMGVTANRNWAGHVFIDFTLRTGLNSLTCPKGYISYIWNNLSPKTKYYQRPVDFLVLDTKALGSLPTSEFEKKLQEMDPLLKDLLVQDRASRIFLETTGRFGDQSYALLGEMRNVRIYKAI